MASKKKKDAGSGEFSFFDRITQELLSAQSEPLNIIDFIEQILDAFDTTKTPLFPAQRVILKAMYNIPMNEDERELMDRWVGEKKCNWLPNDLVLAEINAQRELDNKPPKERFNYLEIVLQCGMRCVTGDSYVFFPGEGYRRMDNLLPQAGDRNIESILNKSVQTRHGIKPVVRGLSRPSTATRRVSTRYGYEIEGSLEHPMLVMTPSGLVWKKMSELSIGDYLCAERKPLPASAYPSDHQFDYDGRRVSGPELAYILGLLAGDGAVTEQGKISLTTIDSGNKEAFLGLEELFGKKAATYPKDSSQAEEISIHCTRARRWLKDTAGVEYAGSYSKTIPRWIMEGSREEISQFIRGLFDTDGYALTDSTCVGISLASKELIRQLQILLNGFGVISSRKRKTLKYVRQNGEFSTTWKLEMNGNDARRYGMEIGFGLLRKQEIVDSYGPMNEHGSTVDKIPHLTAALRAAKQAEGLSSRGSGRASKWGSIRRQCSGTTRRTDMSKGAGITYSLLPKVIDYFTDVSRAQELVKQLEELQTQNLFFDEIVSIVDGYAPVYDICVPEVSEYVANGLVSHNSGKSATVGLMVAYEFYKLITCPNPQEKYNLPSSSIIYLSALASSERQTLGTIFGYVKNYITGSTFFKSQIDDGRIIVKELEIVFPEKNIILASGHSRADTLVGRTAMMVAFDELAMFSVDEGKTSNAGDVYARVGRSVATFPDDGKRVAMSSVKEEGDFMQQLIEDGWDKQHRGMLIFDLTTFEFNPTKTYDDPVISGDFSRDPIAAARDYENIRPSSAYAYINPFIVDKATRIPDPTNPENEITFDRYTNCIYRTIQVPRSDPSNPAAMMIMTGLDVGLPKDIDSRWQSIAHCDPGSVRDSYGFACGHAEPGPKGIVTVIDIVLEWCPIPLGKGAKAPVDLLNVEEAIKLLAGPRKIQRVTFDQFQSDATIQALNRAGIPAAKLHFAAGNQFDMYELLRLRLNQGLVKIPNDPTLVEELKNLQMSTSGKKVDHPKNKDSQILGRGKISKDLADCIAVVNWHIASQERVFARDAYESFSGQAAGSGGGVQAIQETKATQGRIDWKFK